MLASSPEQENHSCEEAAYPKNRLSLYQKIKK